LHRHDHNSVKFRQYHSLNRRNAATPKKYVIL